MNQVCNASREESNKVLWDSHDAKNLWFENDTAFGRRTSQVTSTDNLVCAKVCHINLRSTNNTPSNMFHVEKENRLGRSPTMASLESGSLKDL